MSKNGSAQNFDEGLVRSHSSSMFIDGEQDSNEVVVCRMTGLENFQQKCPSQDSYAICNRSLDPPTDEQSGFLSSQYFQLSDSVSKTSNGPLRGNHQDLYAPFSNFEKSGSILNSQTCLESNIQNEFKPKSYNSNQTSASHFQDSKAIQKEFLLSQGGSFCCEVAGNDFPANTNEKNGFEANTIETPRYTTVSRLEGSNQLLSTGEIIRLAESVGSGIIKSQRDLGPSSSVSLPRRANLLDSNLQEKQGSICTLFGEGSGSHADQEPRNSNPPEFQHLLENSSSFLKTHLVPIEKSTPDYSFVAPAVNYRSSIENQFENGNHETNQPVVSSVVAVQANRKNVFTDTSRWRQDYEKSNLAETHTYKNAQRLAPKNPYKQKRSKRKERQLNIIRRTLGYDEKGDPLPGTFVCPDPYCKKLFGCLQSRSRHFALQHRQKKKEFECKTCMQSYVSKENLHKHIGNCHDPKLPTIFCEQCTAHFSSTFCLQAHKNNAHAQKRQPRETQRICFVCPICQETALEENNLYRHIRLIHKPFDDCKYVCDQCGVRKNTKSNLKAHINTVHRKDEFR